MGVTRAPRTLEAAVSSYKEARQRLEGLYGVDVPRSLGREVEPALRGS
jgi:hypothetical protein